jgi:hypothetical protein
MFPNVESIFNLSDAISLALGAVLMRMWYWLQDKRLDRSHPESAPHSRRWKSVTMAWAVITVAIMYMFVETHNAYALTRQNANDIRNDVQTNTTCQHEFFTALQTRSMFTNKSDDLAYQQRVLLLHGQQLTSDLINQLDSPPGTLGALPVDDPRRQQFRDDAVRDYLKQIGDVEQQVASLQTEQQANRKARNDTDLSCGK